MGQQMLHLLAAASMPVGGHNLIEPAAWACPVISGPHHIFNFSEIERLLRRKRCIDQLRMMLMTLATAIDNLLKLMTY
jgi:3-deoxy-D-manno-octulosonic-acid transferase